MNFTNDQKRKIYDKYFMDVAVLTAQLSQAQRKKVGAILVKDKRICSMGFNGTPHGWEDNCCEDVLPDGSLVTKPIVVHAEANALFWCSKTQVSTEGATLYLTLSPCATCAISIIQSGIKRVVYLEKYRDDTGIEILKKAGITIEQFKQEIRK